MNDTPETIALHAFEAGHVDADAYGIVKQAHDDWSEGSAKYTYQCLGFLKARLERGEKVQLYDPDSAQAVETASLPAFLDWVKRYFPDVTSL